MTSEARLDNEPRRAAPEFKRRRDFIDAHKIVPGVRERAAIKEFFGLALNPFAGYSHAALGCRAAASAGLAAALADMISRLPFMEILAWIS